MENPHEDQLKIKSSKLLSNYKYIKKLRSRWISGQCIIVFEKNWTNHAYWEGNNLKTVNLKIYYFVNLHRNWHILFCNSVQKMTCY